MNWSIVKELVKINFLYANPQTLGALQAQRAKNPHKKFSLFKKLRNQFLIMMTLFMVIYVPMFMGINYRESTGYFSVQLGLFSLIALVSGFSSLFSVFYDSQDNKLYLSLPVKASEVYLAKLLSAQGTSLTYLMPCLSLMGIVFWQLSQSPLLILLALPATLILLAAVNAINLIVLHFIGQLLTKSPHKKRISTLLLGLSTFLSLGLLLFLQSLTPSVTATGGIHLPQIPYFIGFYHLVAEPFGAMAGLHFWLPLLILGGLITYIIKTILPNYFDQLHQIDSQASSARPKKKRSASNKERSLKQVLTRHHLSTIQDGTLLIQAYLIPLIFCFSMIGPALANSRGRFDLSGLDWSYYGLAMLAGLNFGALTSGANSLLSVGISLERENLTFIKSLPINFKDFLLSKYWVLFWAQTLPVLSLQVGLAALIAKVPLVLLASYALGFFISAHLMGMVMYKRDYRLLNLTWQNISQLFNRGGSPWLVGLIAFASMILGIASMAVSAILTTVYSPASVSFSLLTLTLFVAGLGYALIHHPFGQFLDKIEAGD